MLNWFASKRTLLRSVLSGVLRNVWIHMELGVDIARAHLQPLIDEVRRNLRSSEYGGKYFATSVEGAEFGMQSRLIGGIERLTPAGNAHRRTVDDILKTGKHAQETVVDIAAVAEAVVADYEAGYLTSVQQLIHADVFADFLEMADELVKKNYKDPAAVLAGSTLEEHLRKLAAQSGVSPNKPDGAPKKADTLNADLVKAGAYDKLEQKSVTAWLGLRNHAAHGEYDTYDRGQVEALIRDVRAFMIRHRA